jgi:hypothetical protein
MELFFEFRYDALDLPFGPTSRVSVSAFQQDDEIVRFTFD